MKQLLVVDGVEIQAAVMAMIVRRQSMKDRFVGAVHLVCDPEEPRANLRIRCQVVHFDTEKAAREYAEKPSEADKDLAPGVATAPAAGAGAAP